MNTARSLVFVSLLSVFCVGAPGETRADACDIASPSATEPAVRRGHEIRLRKRIDAITAQLSRRKHEAIIFGDSIVQQWPKPSLDKAFEGFDILNAGVAGDGAAALLFRLTGQMTPATVDGERISIGVEGLADQKPRLVALLIGTNDLKRNAECDVFSGVLNVIKRLNVQYPGARIVVISLLPRGGDQRQYEGAIATVNRSLAAAASDKTSGVTFEFVEANDDLRCEHASQCDVARPPNYVHLTPQGYERLAAAVRRRLTGASQ